MSVLFTPDVVTSITKSNDTKIASYRVWLFLYFSTNVYPGTLVASFALLLRPTRAMVRAVPIVDYVLYLHSRPATFIPVRNDSHPHTQARRVLAQWLLVSLLILQPIINLGFGLVVFHRPRDNLSTFARLVYFYGGITVQPVLTAISFWEAILWSRCHVGNANR